MLTINSDSQLSLCLEENYREGVNDKYLVTEYYQHFFLIRRMLIRSVNTNVLFQFVCSPSKLSEIAAIQCQCIWLSKLCTAQESTSSRVIQMSWTCIFIITISLLKQSRDEGAFFPNLNRGVICTSNSPNTYYSKEVVILLQNHLNSTQDVSLPDVQMNHFSFAFVILNKCAHK